jgi:serine/threonine-protein kinase
MTDYAKEARKAQKQGDLVRAGDFYMLSGNIDSAIDMYLEGKHHAQAARLLEKQESWRPAAQCYAQAGSFERAAKMYMMVEDWDKAAGMFEKLGDPSRASEMHQKNGNMLKAAEFADKAEKLERAAPLYEKAGQHARAAELYLQLLNRVAGEVPDEAGLLESRRIAISRYGTAAGSLFFRLQQFEKAAFCFQKAENFARAAESYKAAGQPLKAVELYIEAEDFRNASEIMEKIGKITQASELAEKAKDPERAAMLAEKSGQALRAAILYTKAGKQPKAADLYFQQLIQSIDDAAKNKLPGSQRVNIQKLGTTAGAIYLNLKNPAKAGWCFEQAGQISKAAECYSQGKLYEKAAEMLVRTKTYDKAYEMLMNEKEVRNKGLLADVLFHTAHYVEAGELYRVANLPAKAAVAYENAGENYKAAILFEELGDFLRAAGLYAAMKERKRAAELYESGKDFANAALCYEAVGNLPKAAECAMKTNQKLLAARLLEKLGDSQKSVSLLQEIPKESEEYLDACRDLGRLFLQMGIFQPAAQKLTEFVANQSPSKENLDVFYELATALEATGEKDQAMGIYQKILSIQLDFKDVLDRLKGIQGINASTKSASGPLPMEAKVQPVTPRPSSGSDGGEDTFQLSLEGKRIREYEILEILGKGGMGTVYRARHVYLNKERAIKVIQSKLTNSSLADRFVREAQILGDLRHPNLVQLFEFGSLDGNSFFMVLELIEGESVKTRIQRLGKLPLKQAIQITQEAASGLQLAHNKGIVHRDISPDNIMLVTDENGKEITKVIDFGIAKALLDDTLDQTLTNTFIGKPEYASPEQCGFLKQGEIIDSRSDIFSLAITFYYMLSGSLPFSSPTPQGYLVKHMSQKPRPLLEVLPDSPQGLNEIIQKALSTGREKRQSTMEEFARELDQIAR